MIEDNKRIWVISEVYYPDEAGGAHFMTQFAEGLAQFFDVSVLCGYRSYTHRGVALPVKSIRNKVALERCYQTCFNRNIFIFRLININRSSEWLLPETFKAFLLVLRGGGKFILINSSS